MKKIAILGSTGSIGTQALEVISHLKDDFKVELLSAYSNFDLLSQQVKKFKPKTIIFGDNSKSKILEKNLKQEKVNIIYGEDALNNFFKYSEVDIVLTALVGKSGLIPTINAINNNINIALANKETLVIAGDIIKKLCENNKVNIFPVDSEHSAIYQCLLGEKQKNVDKIILTASGGPFKGKSIGDLKYIKKEDALNHPNWDMGNKISIDSSTLMNKGLEVIEAKYLFNLDIDQINVLVHPQAVVHGIVTYKDNSMISLMSLPDMRIPISSLLFPKKEVSLDDLNIDLANIETLNFYEIDESKFPAIKVAKEVLDKGGLAPNAFNYTNEKLVNHFINKNIGFLDIVNFNIETLDKYFAKNSNIENPTIDDILNMNKWIDENIYLGE